MTSSASWASESRRPLPIRSSRRSPTLFSNQGNLAAKTIQTKRELLAPILDKIGAAKLRHRTADDVLSA
jgi:hypothetical protein